MKVCNCVGVAVLRHDIENSDSKNVKRKKKDAVQRNRENLLNRIQIQFNSEYNQAKRNESFNKNRGKT